MVVSSRFAEGSGKPNRFLARSNMQSATRIAGGFRRRPIQHDLEHWDYRVGERCNTSRFRSGGRTELHLIVKGARHDYNYPKAVAQLGG
jgi:hypothetical protein